MIGEIEDYSRVDIRLRRVLTQYRESPKLLNWLRTCLRQVEIVEQAINKMPEHFDLDTAVGDQLTLIGKRLGFPRLHCVCTTQPVFGFLCPTNQTEVLGFCEGVSWASCADFGVAYVAIDDDELYRKFLKVRRYQVLALFDVKSLRAALQIFWGETAKIMDQGRGRVVVTPGRDLTEQEIQVLQLYPRVLPVGLGISVRFHFGSIRAFGFGVGWGGFCDGEAVDGQALLTENDEEILTENDEPLLADNLGIGSDWMCEIDVRPYDC